MIVAIKEPKLIISPNASATDKRLLLSKELAPTFISTTTFQKIATVTNFTALLLYHNFFSDFFYFCPTNSPVLKNL